MAEINQQKLDLIEQHFSDLSPEDQIRAAEILKQHRPSSRVLGAQAVQAGPKAKPYDASTRGIKLNEKVPGVKKQPAGVPQNYGVDDMAGGLSDSIRHVATAATPAMAGPLLESTLPTLIHGGVGMGAQHLLEQIGNALGLPGMGKLSGDAAMLSGLGGKDAVRMLTGREMQSPIAFDNPRMPELSTVIDGIRGSTGKSPNIRANLKEALGYNLMRKLSGVNIRSPLAPEEAPLPEWLDKFQALKEQSRQLGQPGVASPAPDPPPQMPAEAPTLPSGRIPGHLRPPQPPPVAPPPRVPIWQQGESFQIGEDRLPDIEAIPATQFPSGRVPGHLQPPREVPPPPAPRREPLWKQLNIEPTPRPLEDFTPIPATQFPSGRVPGTGVPKPSVPPAAGNTPVVSTPPPLKAGEAGGTGTPAPTDIHHQQALDRLNLQAENAIAKDVNVRNYMKAKGLSKADFDAMENDDTKWKDLFKEIQGVYKLKTAYRTSPDFKARWKDTIRRHLPDSPGAQ